MTEPIVTDLRGKLTPPAAVSAPPADPGASVSPAPAAAGSTETPKPVVPDPAVKPAVAADPIPATTDTEKPTEPAKPAEGQPPVQDPAETPVFDLKLPANAVLDASHVAQVTDFAKKYGLSHDAAQALLDDRNALLAAQRPTIEQAFQKTQQETHKTVTIPAWQKAVETDREMGGQHIKETNLAMDRAVRRFGSPAFAQLIKDSGYEFHPELRRFISRIGRAISDDKLVTGGESRRPKSAAEVFYPEDSKPRAQA